MGVSHRQLVNFLSNVFCPHFLVLLVAIVNVSDCTRRCENEVFASLLDAMCTFLELV